jgi:hypothetical protein
MDLEISHRLQCENAAACYTRSWEMGILERSAKCAPCSRSKCPLALLTWNQLNLNFAAVVVHSFDF